MNLEPIAINQMNYPILIMVYSIDDDRIRFKSVYANGHECSDRMCTNKLYSDAKDGRIYFRHLGDKYYLDETTPVITS